jgi:hypothetical protein
MGWLTSKKPKTIKKPKICPLIKNVCMQEKCMMYRTRINGDSYCGLAPQNTPEAHIFYYEEVV